MQLKKKQTSLIVITIIAILIFIWQAIELLQSDIFSKSNENITLTAPSKTIIPAKRTPVIHTATAAELATYQAGNLTGKRHAYLELVNRYEFAKMRHRLLQEELAIADTRQKIAAINQQMGTYNTSERFSVTGYNNADSPNNLTSEQIKLVYLDLQQGQWSATLSKSDQFQQVHAGSQLADGSRVVDINKQGVLIQAGEHRFKLDFNGITPLPSALRMAPPPILHSTSKPPTVKEPIAIPTSPSNHSSSVPTKRTLDEKVLLEMPATSFTLRLRDSENKNALLDYAKKLHIADRTFCYAHTKNRRPLYTLVYGDYLTTEAAHAALAQLPIPLRQQNIKIQRLVHIQHEITG